MFQKMRVLLLAGVLVIAVSSCRKILEEVINGGGNSPYIPKCSILKYTGKDVFLLQGSGNEPFTRTFTYNAQGNPISSNVVPEDYYNNPDFKFYYNSQNQLKELVYNERYRYIDLNNDNIVDTLRETFVLHRYTHDSKGNIITDSTFYNYSSSKYFVYFSGTRVDKHEYDSFGRMIKSTETYTNYVYRITTYHYNSQGNLAKITLINPENSSETTSRDIVNYDTKRNYRLTNRIWQFIDRDYSLNNGFTVDQYNNTGLPVKFNGSVLEYSCK